MSQKSEILHINILDFLQENPRSSSKEIYEGIVQVYSYATIKRALLNLQADKYVVISGKGKATKYEISSSYAFLKPINTETYFQKEIDDRIIKSGFQFGLIQQLTPLDIFTNEELEKLNELQAQFSKKSMLLSEVEFKQEYERLAIDLSWKSSQIEGNTYSLLETERLLKEQETATGKTKEEATMLRNHKSALDFILDHPDYLKTLSLSRMEDIHSILIKDLNVSRNIRQRRVGISGTNYVPLDNEHQIREALDDLCHLVNQKENIFEKALLVLLLISYIQPFADGNKRTARIISNALLISQKYCPLSFRTIDALQYKKAMLIFYEQNNLSAFKKMWINQVEFAVNTYF